MPELPEVQTVVDSLNDLVLNKQIKEVEVINEKLIANMKAEEFKETLQGAEIESIKRRGKYIIITLDNSYYLITHLRMTGRFVYVEGEEELSKYDYIIFYFTGEDELRLGSKRKFTRTYLVTDFEEAGGLAEVGPEPLSSEFTAERFKEMLASRRGKIKPLLLNQKFLAGLGNIYVDESLFRAGVHPARKADTLTEEEMEGLYYSIVEVLEEGIEHRGTTKWDYVDASGQGGSYQDKLQVYDREGKECVKCASKLERIKIGGRSTYFCPECQQEE